MRVILWAYYITESKTDTSAKRKLQILSIIEKFMCRKQRNKYKKIILCCFLPIKKLFYTILIAVFHSFFSVVAFYSKKSGKEQQK
jgi:hypothetical protein